MPVKKKGTVKKKAAKRRVQKVAGIPKPDKRRKKKTDTREFS